MVCKDVKKTLKNGSTLLVRSATREDVTDILVCLQQAGGETDNLLMDGSALPFTVEEEENFIKKCNEDAYSCFLCGFVDGKLIAVASSIVPTNRRISHWGEFSIMVLKSHWGIGVGQAITKNVIRLSKKAGLHHLHLGVRADNQQAIALYKKLGFKEFGRHPMFFCVNGKYYDEILMSLRLKNTAHR